MPGGALTLELEVHTALGLGGCPKMPGDAPTLELEVQTALGL